MQGLVVHYCNEKIKLSPYWIIGTLYMFVTMFVPTSMSVLSMAMLLLWLIVAVTREGKFRFNRKGLLLLYIYSSYMVVSSLYGMVNHKFDSFSRLRPYVLFPLIYVVVFFEIKKEEIAYLKKLMLLIEGIICVYDLWFCFAEMHVISWFPSFLKGFGLVPIFNGKFQGFYQYTTTHMVTHIFMIPFTAAMIFETVNAEKPDWKILILFCMEIICAYLSGRAALQIVSVICTLGVILIGNWMDKMRKSKKISRHKSRGRILIAALACTIILLAIILFSGINKGLTGTIEYIKSKLTGSYYELSYSSGIDYRSLQRKTYINGWLESPLFGHGMGAYDTTINRGGSGDGSYQTELTYIFMLFQFGIVGIVLFVMIILDIIRKYIKKEKNLHFLDESITPFIIGMVAILIATSRDPYLFKLGCIWMVFLPFTIVNKNT